VTEAGFAAMARSMRRLARELDVPVGLVLEGGYDLVALEAGLLAATRGIVEGTAVEIARDPDHEDIARASRAAHDVWKTVG
jgi:acetoin utilization deacetylase AcuC-like enzyme